MTHTLSAETARRLKRLIIENSALIEEYTRQVCPTCNDICCKQRHGLFTETDHAYLAALDEEIPPHDKTLPLDGPCQFLGPSGCAKPRWQRAWKCTWYFCDPLIRVMEERPGRSTRQFTRAMEEMIRLYDQLKG